MKVTPKKSIVFNKAKMKRAKRVSVAKLIAADEGSPTVAMRLFEIAPGGQTPWHAHDWEHVIFGVKGRGILKTENGDAPFGPGDSLLVEPDEEHNFVNAGAGVLTFVCIVPLRGDV